jgi:hypothetical protein
MANIDELYPKQFLQAADLQDGDWELTITHTEVREFEDFNKQKKNKLVLSFAEISQKFPLTPTNAGRIAAQYGKDYTKYIGKTIIVGLEDEPKAQGGVAIRIKVPVRVVKPATPARRGPPLATRAPAPASEEEAADAGADEQVNF